MNNYKFDAKTVQPVWRHIATRLQVIYADPAQTVVEAIALPLTISGAPIWEAQPLHIIEQGFLPSMKGVGPYHRPAVYRQGQPDVHEIGGRYIPYAGNEQAVDWLLALKAAEPELLAQERLMEQQATFDTMLGTSTSATASWLFGSGSHPRQAQANDVTPQFNQQSANSNLQRFRALPPLQVMDGTLGTNIATQRMGLSNDTFAWLDQYVQTLGFRTRKGESVRCGGEVLVLRGVTPNDPRVQNLVALQRGESVADKMIAPPAAPDLDISL